MDSGIGVAAYAKAAAPNVLDAGGTLASFRSGFIKHFYCKLTQSLADTASDRSALRVEGWALSSPPMKAARKGRPLSWSKSACRCTVERGRDRMTSPHVHQREGEVPPAPPSSTVNCAVSLLREFDRGGKPSIFRALASSCQNSPHAVNRSLR